MLRSWLLSIILLTPFGAEICCAWEVSLTLWSFEGAASRFQHFTLSADQTCYAVSTCALESISFAKWSTIPRNTKLVFYSDDSCSVMNYFATRNDDKSLSFSKAGVNENVSAVMILDDVSISVKHSNICSNLYVSGAS
ncbi:unnamed protein product [Phytophthora lilii]|uniref:Unnamed protein product n=1 Tax=Phytophthora lilii TaxID=2077276 RepID=A0A9W7DAG3_9STRA|nr:unnamed protein product [Phytophthora lilii]